MIKSETNTNMLKKDKPKKVKVSLTIDIDTLERTQKLAELDDRSLSQYINRILKEHLRNI